MYEPKPFRVDDRATLLEGIRAWPLGLLVAPGEDGPSADLVPFVVAPEGDVLRAHVARANPLARQLAAAAKVLVVFMGPQAYVSPGFYPSKRRDGRVVPTWNYAMIQVEGIARLREARDWMEMQLDALTAQQEAGRPDVAGGEQEPWRREDAPEDFLSAQMPAIVGLEIEIIKVAGKYKMSQNRSAEDRLGVIAGLARDTEASAQAMAVLMSDGKAPKKIG